MRQNLPVTQNEYPIAEGAAIISRTDLAGHITYCNDEFVVASGFNREEVVGEPHNILRHPDMPSEAYRDMWATLQRGRPWSGIVKNRRKNGDFYWVRATATPLADGSGYMSVRIKARREEISSAEALYARMRQDPGIRLDEGRLAANGVGAALAKALPRTGLATRIGLINAGLAALCLCVGIAGLNATDRARSAIDTLHQGQIQALQAAPDTPARDQLKRLSDASEAARSTIEADYGHTRTLLAALGAGGVALAAVASWLLIRRLHQSVDAGKRVAEAIAAGNMLQPLPAASND